MVKPKLYKNHANKRLKIYWKYFRSPSKEIKHLVPAHSQILNILKKSMKYFNVVFADEENFCVCDCFPVQSVKGLMIVFQIVWIVTENCNKHWITIISKYYSFNQRKLFFYLYLGIGLLRKNTLFQYCHRFQNVSYFLAL